MPIGAWMPSPTPEPPSPFAGFPAGAKTVPIPAALLQSLAPQMDDPAELLVSLYAVAAVLRLRRFPRLLDVAALQAERPLVDALARLLPADEVAATFQRGLQAAVRRGTLLTVQAAAPAGPRLLLTINSAADRRSLERVQRGELAPAPATPLLPVAPRPPRNIYALYEDSIGPISTQIAEELSEAEGLYPWSWIEDAFREAGELNKRSWRYIRRILERWQEEGRDDQAAERSAGLRRDPEYGHLFQR